MSQLRWWQPVCVLEVVYLFQLIQIPLLLESLRLLALTPIAHRCRSLCIALGQELVRFLRYLRQFLAFVVQESALLLVGCEERRVIIIKLLQVHHLASEVLQLVVVVRLRQHGTYVSIFEINEAPLSLPAALFGLSVVAFVNPILPDANLAIEALREGLIGTIREAVSWFVDYWLPMLWLRWL